MSFLSGLPPVDQAQLPADVRDASPARRSAYEAGLGFEQLLVQQLSQSLVDSTGDGTDDGSGGGTDAASGIGGGSPYASLLPDALDQGVMGAGGLGLARQLMDAIAPGDAASGGPAPGAAASGGPLSGGAASGGAAPAPTLVDGASALATATTTTPAVGA